MLMKYFVVFHILCYCCSLLLDFFFSAEADPSPSWLAAYFQEFRKRLISLLSFEFRKLPINLGLSLLQTRNKEVIAALQSDRKGQIVVLLVTHVLSQCLAFRFSYHSGAVVDVFVEC